jgi:poly(ADP-ribose) glycohydrolase
VIVPKDWHTWENSTAPMRAIRILEDVSIEDFKEPNLSVDFAASHIGGGVLRGGCVQEEIMFLTHPEMLLSLLF